MTDQFDDYPYLQFTEETKGQLDVIRAQMGLGQGEIVGAALGIGIVALQLLMTESAHVETDPVLTIGVRESSDEGSPVVATISFTPLNNMVRAYREDYANMKRSLDRGESDNTDGPNVSP